MYTELKNYIGQQVLPGVVNITSERKALLDQISATIQQQQDTAHTTKLLFVCTHNSRRSQLAQAWAWIAQQWYKVDRIESHSAGTEVTAFHPNALETLKRVGVQYGTKASNMVELSIAEGNGSALFFSKTTEDPSIPKENMIAIMTCSDAEENCPYIPGADARIPLRYTDPKVSDNRPDTQEVYDKTCLQIATEMFYLFQQLN